MVNNFSRELQNFSGELKDISRKLNNLLGLRTIFGTEKLFRGSRRIIQLL